MLALLNDTSAICEERVRLADAVAGAIKQAYDARTAYLNSSKDRAQSDALKVDLTKARAAELVAIEALTAHRYAHGC